MKFKNTFVCVLNFHFVLIDLKIIVLFLFFTVGLGHICSNKIGLVTLVTFLFVIMFVLHAEFQ